MYKSNISSAVLLPLFLSAIVFLNACSSDGDERPDYLDAASVSSLEIPPKLTTPNTSGALRLPKPSKNALNAQSVKKDTATTIAPEFNGVRLKNESRLYWLEIDSPIEDVWATLPRFLAAEGIEVERVEKLLGFIDTKWMNEYQISYAREESNSWFTGFSPDYKDKFRVRLEAYKNKTRMYVSHRGMQIALGDDLSEWIQRDSEPLLEREIMYRFVLFAGASKSSATDLLAGYRGYQSRVTVADDNVSVFEVQGDKDTVWLRLKIAMDRLGVEMKQTDRKNGKIEVLVGNLNIDDTVKEQSAGWFSGLFGNDVDVGFNEDYESGDYEKAKTIVNPEDRVTVHVRQLSKQYASTIKLTNADGSKVENGLSREFRDGLVQQLK